MNEAFEISEDGKKNSKPTKTLACRDIVCLTVCLQDYEEEDKLLILECKQHWLTIRKTCSVCRIGTDGLDNKESQHEDLFDLLGSSSSRIINIRFCSK